MLKNMREVRIAAAAGTTATGGLLLCLFLGLSPENAQAFVRFPAQHRLVHSARADQVTTVYPRGRYSILRLAAAGPMTKKPSLKPSWKKSPTLSSPPTQQPTNSTPDASIMEASSFASKTKPALEAEASRKGRSFAKPSWKMAKTPSTVYEAVTGTAVADQAEENMRATTYFTTTPSTQAPSVEGSADVVSEPAVAGAPAASSTTAAWGTEDTVAPFKPAWDEVNITIRRAKESLAPFRKKLQDNIAEGNFGERGEEWAVAQVVILLFVALGTIPIVGGVVMLLAGPGLLLAGLAVMLAGASGLGDSLTPWPAPVDDNELSTTGIYGIMRHPQYSGLIMATLGFGVATGSPIRMCLGILLAFVLDRKAVKEEDLLVAKHGEVYEAYRKSVAKFVPRFY